MIALTLLIRLSQRVLHNVFIVKFEIWSSNTFHLLVEPENNTYIYWTISKNDIALREEFAILQRVRLRL
jgi:hypothetical protein